ncbi:MAG TPA: DUF402 domain-containing protein [Symbiobacteriaceae bacterium]|jgi:hypothetical protein
MKRIIIDMNARTEHHMLSGSTFQIDRRLERRGVNIHLDRTYTHHPSISSIRSILMPRHHLWVMFWEGHGGPHPFQSYIHMARVLDGGDVITVEDLYLDVIIRQDGRWQVVDIDEFRVAVGAGELSPDQVQASLLGLEYACKLVDGARGHIERHLKETLLKPES